jgi:hypothetical protein
MMSTLSTTPSQSDYDAVDVSRHDTHASILALIQEHPGKTGEELTELYRILKGWHPKVLFSLDQHLSDMVYRRGWVTVGNNQLPYYMRRYYPMTRDNTHVVDDS